MAVPFTRNCRTMGVDLTDNNGLTAVQRELRAPVPDGLRSLSDADLHDLARAIADERHRQAAALAAAGDAALGQLPRVIRIPIKRLLG
jgi:hypothetical protein